MHKIIKIALILTPMILVSGCESVENLHQPSVQTQCLTLKTELSRLQFNQRANPASNTTWNHKPVSPVTIEQLQDQYQSLNCQMVTGQADYANVTN